MDPQTDLPELVEDLEVNIDELSAALEPLLATPVHTAASSLPLLDKAKLYWFAAYSIESLLFSALKASGVDATNHAVFKELARLRGYNNKIKDIEDRGIKGSAEGRARLDVGAAQRFIKHGLAGNEKYDLERRERMAKEKARAHLKAQKINKKFDEEGKVVESEVVTPTKRGVEELDNQEEDEEVLTGLEEAQPATKKARISVSEPMDIDSEPIPSSDAKPKKKEKKPQKTKSKKAEKKSKQSADSTEAETSQQDEDATSLSILEPSASPPPQPKKRGRPPNSVRKAQQASSKSTPSDPIIVSTPEPTPSKQEARVTRNRNKRLSTQNTAEEEAVVPEPEKMPKTRSETFNALLDGSIGEQKVKAKPVKRGGKKGAK